MFVEIACRSRLRSPGSRYEWSFLVSVDVEVQVSMVERQRQRRRDGSRYITFVGQVEIGEAECGQYGCASRRFFTSHRWHFLWVGGQVRLEVKTRCRPSGPSPPLQRYSVLVAHTGTPPHRRTATARVRRAALSPSPRNVRISRTRMSHLHLLSSLLWHPCFTEFIARYHSYLPTTCRQSIILSSP